MARSVAGFIQCSCGRIIYSSIICQYNQYLLWIFTMCCAVFWTGKCVWLLNKDFSPVAEKIQTY